jgi:hypothetical protein
MLPPHHAWHVTFALIASGTAQIKLKYVIALTFGISRSLRLVTQTKRGLQGGNSK